ncbi:hypothetical protein Cyrtocomes_00137 [Candidatus Cyrtobacter comes]|uniref:Uncharacterized protein n=1 Tax=Candidatus Cyrtobacter comes TaxID=675776 RepID=A0ABU5L6N0_9RICK|nr:hypothetical protein [Candidatus Cyrtobacter comes]
MLSESGLRKGSSLISEMSFGERLLIVYHALTNIFGFSPP